MLKDYFKCQTSNLFEFGQSETVCTKNVYEVIEEIHERGGLAVLAHIDQLKGIFHNSVKKNEKGNTSVPASLRKILNEAPFDAVECTEGDCQTGSMSSSIKTKSRFLPSFRQP